VAGGLVSRVNATLSLIGATWMALFNAVIGIGSVGIGGLLLLVRWSWTGVLCLSVGTLLCLLSCYWFTVAYVEGWKPLRSDENQCTTAQQAEESLDNE
jgi:hypothetical protein